MPGWTKRRMQFESGPQTMTFYACPALVCRAELAAGRILCFLCMRNERAMPITDEEAADEHCSICGVDIEGGGRH